MSRRYLVVGEPEAMEKSGHGSRQLDTRLSMIIPGRLSLSTTSEWQVVFSKSDAEAFVRRRPTINRNRLSVRAVYCLLSPSEKTAIHAARMCRGMELLDGVSHGAAIDEIAASLGYSRGHIASLVPRGMRLEIEI
jgi:hypothetical protein